MQVIKASLQSLVLPSTQKTFLLQLQLRSKSQVMAAEAQWMLQKRLFNNLLRQAKRRLDVVYHHYCYSDCSSAHIHVRTSTLLQATV